MTREEIFAFAAAKWGTKPDYPWQEYPDYAVLRHEYSRKWYALIMNVNPDRIGLEGKDMVDIVNLKCQPPLVTIMLEKKGVFPAWHMNRKHWISVLPEPFPEEELTELLELSWRLTAGRRKRKE